MVMRKIFILFVTLVLVFPVYWLFAGSLRDSPGMFSIPPKLIPTAITLDNYRNVFQDTRIGRWVVNTVLIAVMAVAGGILVSFSGGWFLAMNKGIVPKLITAGLLISFMVPRQTLMIPMFVEIRKLGLVNTLLGAVAPLWYAPVSVMFARNWIRSAPKVYWEDAQLMGAHGWTLFRHVIMPLSTPVVGLAFLTQGVSSLSDFLWQSLTLQTTEIQTAYLGLMINIQMAASKHLPNTQGLQLAISVVMLLPLIIVGLLAQRQFGDNLSRGIAE